MRDIFNCYNLDIERLIWFYQRLNEEIIYPDGMVTSLGIGYWGEDRHIADLETAIPRLEAMGIQRFDELWESTRTKGRLKKLSQRTGISQDILRILKHDIELWLPKAVPLEELEPFQKHPEYREELARIGVNNQLQMISSGSTPQHREQLSAQIMIPLEMVVEMVKYCDMYRMGTKLDSIRKRVYYDMGLDTWRKWADLTAEVVIAMFADYVEQHDVTAVRQVPRPKEVRNTIEWAKWHLSIFEVEW